MTIERSAELGTSLISEAEVVHTLLLRRLGKEALVPHRSDATRDVELRAPGTRRNRILLSDYNTLVWHRDAFNSTYGTDKHQRAIRIFDEGHPILGLQALQGRVSEVMIGRLCDFETENGFLGTLITHGLPDVDLTRADYAVIENGATAGLRQVTSPLRHPLVSRALSFIAAEEN